MSAPRREAATSTPLGRPDQLRGISSRMLRNSAASMRRYPVILEMVVEAQRTPSTSCRDQLHYPSGGLHALNSLLARAARPPGPSD